MKVRTRRLSKAYGFLWALKDISLELRPGECVALFGPNGAGKTTLLKLLAGLAYPTTGEIDLDGEKLVQGASSLRSKIGFLTPKEHLYESLTAEENLRLFNALYAKKKPPAEIDDTLMTAGLAAYSGQYVSALSSGMRCRLSLAKWLLLEPKLFLIDEPYGVLDGGGVDLLESFLRSLCRSGGTVIMATHHVPRALALCTRALILYQGKLIFDEPRQEPWENFYRVYGEFLPRGEKWSS